MYATFESKLMKDCFIGNFGVKSKDFSFSPQNQSSKVHFSKKKTLLQCSLLNGKDTEIESFLQ